jgi:quercetin dioxygenase-like cupin family protein
MHIAEVSDLIEYSAEKRVRKQLFLADRIVSELVCYEPGQDTVAHQHPRQDEIFYVVEGAGTIVVEDREIPARTGTSVLVPAGAKHSIRADRASRFVILFFKGPGIPGKPAVASAAPPAAGSA